MVLVIVTGGWIEMMEKITVNEKVKKKRDQNHEWIMQEYLKCFQGYTWSDRGEDRYYEHFSILKEMRGMARRD